MLNIIKNFFKSTEGYQPESASGDPVAPPSHPNGLPEPTETPPMPPVVPPKAKKPRKPRKPRKPKAPSAPEVGVVPVETEKERATRFGEPWVSVVRVNLDNDMGSGNFELDWNEYFIAKLFKAGYRGSNDAAIVDQWFVELCRNVVYGTFEQDQADPTNRTAHTRNDGRSEYQ